MFEPCHNEINANRVMFKDLIARLHDQIKEKLLWGLAYWYNMFTANTGTCGCVFSLFLWRPAYRYAPFKYSTYTHQRWKWGFNFNLKPRVFQPFPYIFRTRSKPPWLFDLLKIQISQERAFTPHLGFYFKCHMLFLFSKNINNHPIQTSSNVNQRRIKVVIDRSMRGICWGI